MQEFPTYAPEENERSRLESSVFNAALLCDKPSAVFCVGMAAE